MIRTSRRLWLVGLGVALMLGSVGMAAGQDADGDGVMDPCDLCPGTPKYHPVDASGCPLQTSEWIGGTSGSLVWDLDTNWNPNVIPTTGAHNVIIDDGLTGPREITTPATPIVNGHSTWVANGGYEDRLVLGADLTLSNSYLSGWFNPSQDPCMMVIDLDGHDLRLDIYYWAAPDITMIGPGTFTFGTGTTHFADSTGPSVDPTYFTAPVIDPSITVFGRALIYTFGAPLPNLTVAEGEVCAFGIGPGTRIEGDLTINGVMNFQSGPHTVGGDVIVKAGDPNAGLALSAGASAGPNFEGDLIDTNTENRNPDGTLKFYHESKTRFSGDGSVQILDVRRPTAMRIIVEPGAHVKLGSDYDAAYSGTYSHLSGVGREATLDVGNYNLTLTDLGSYSEEDANAPTFKYTATGDPNTTGSITILGDANDVLTTGLHLQKFKVEIVDGGGWNFGDDFILFRYNLQASEILVSPDLVDYKLPPKWAHEGVVHDPNFKIVYLDNLRSAICGDPGYMPPEGDLNQDCYVNEGDLPSVAEQWLECTDPTAEGCVEYVMPPEVFYMPHCYGHAVDGLLGDWTDPCWIDLDQIYAGDPNDLLSAKYTVCWDPCEDLFFSAIKVVDTDHVFETAPTDWDSSDRVEIYVQADPNGGDDWGSVANGLYDKAQQYIIGYQGLLDWTWAVFGHGTYLPGDFEPKNAHFTDAGTKSGDTITYEISAKAWQWYGGLSPAVDPNVVRQLEPGIQIGFDVVADSRWGSPPHDDDPNEFGMLSANSMTQKFIFADNFQRWELLDYDGSILPPECGDWGYLPLDTDSDCYISLGDFATWSVHWMKCTHPDPPCDFNPWE